MKQITFKKAFAIIFICALCAGRLLPVYLQGFYLDARCEQNANNPVED